MMGCNGHHPPSLHARSRVHRTHHHRPTPRPLRRPPARPHHRPHDPGQRSRRLGSRLRSPRPRPLERLDPHRPGLPNLPLPGRRLHHLLARRPREKRQLPQDALRPRDPALPEDPPAAVHPGLLPVHALAHHASLRSSSAHRSLLPRRRPHSHCDHEAQIPRARPHRHRRRAARRLLGTAPLRPCTWRGHPRPRRPLHGPDPEPDLVARPRRHGLHPALAAHWPPVPHHPRSRRPAQHPPRRRQHPARRAHRPLDAPDTRRYSPAAASRSATCSSGSASQASRA